MAITQQPPMTPWIAFFRALNVGGRTVTMSRLATLVANAGGSDVTTFLASGNVCFSARSRQESVVRQRLESRLKEALGYEVATFLRSPAALATLVAHPALRANTRDAVAVNVALLHEPLAADAQARVTRLAGPIDRFVFDGREMFWFCARKQSESEFCNTVFERATGVRSTFRSLSTLKRLHARLAQE